jgi:hypothetical protein
MGCDVEENESGARKLDKKRVKSDTVNGRLAPERPFLRKLVPALA